MNFPAAAYATRPPPLDWVVTATQASKITVWDVLGWLADGKSEDQIIDDYPELEKDDFRTAYEYAARVGQHVAL